MLLKPRYPKLNGGHPLAKGLASAYSLHEGAGGLARDAVGNNNGTIVNSPVWTATQLGYAILLNGTTQAVTLGNPSSFPDGSAPFSLCAWINPSAQQDGIIVGRLGTGTENFHLRANRAGSNTFEARWVNSAGTVVSVATSTTTVSSRIGLPTLVAGVFDGVNVWIYINGRAENSATYTLGAAKAGNAWAIGKDNANNGTFFKGSISAVSIYRRGITATEVVELYQDPFAIYRSQRRYVSVDLPKVYFDGIDQQPQPVRQRGNRAAAITPSAPGIDAPAVVPAAVLVLDAPADLRGKRSSLQPTPDLPFGQRVGLDWGFEPTQAVPSVPQPCRQPYAELPRLDTPQLTLAWGAQPTEAWTPPTGDRRRAYPELPRLDLPQMAVTSSGSGALADQDSTAAGSGISASPGTAILADTVSTIVGAGTDLSTGTGDLQDSAATLIAAGVSRSVGTGSLACSLSQIAGIQFDFGVLLAAASTMAGSGLSSSHGSGNLICTAVSAGTGNLAAQAAQIS